LLDGIVDIYLPDFKYADNGTARKYSGVKDYFDVAKEAIKEMYRQVGDLVVDEHGVALRGVLVRHLVLPNGLAGTKTVANVLKEISPNIAVNVMNQYYPCYKAYDYPELARRITLQEFSEALRFMEGLKIIYD
jgi:putative pyruvate formate lyase activating enzyme